MTFAVRCPSCSEAGETADASYLIVMPPDWLNAFTCCTVSVPGPTHAPALFCVGVFEQSVG
ncbi:MAG: hypothetical protein ACRDH5_11060 [bacterium]